MAINILLADDHQIVLEGFKSLLERESSINVVGIATNGKDAIQIAKKHKVDVAVLDVEMPLMDGVETTKFLRKLDKNIKVLILATFNEVKYIQEIVKFGASGYILKNKGHQELVNAIHAVYQGKDFFAEEVAKALGKRDKQLIESENKKNHLSKREVEVLRLIGEGCTTPQISDQLYIAKSTVETHRRSLIEKLDVSGTKDLIRYALKNGFAW